MQRNTSVTLGEHFSKFIEQKIAEGRFESVSEAVRAGLRLLEEEELRVQKLRDILQVGIDQIERGETVDGAEVFDRIFGELRDAQEEL